MGISLTGCKPKDAGSAIASDAAEKVYVAPGKHDEFYNFLSGGFNGQMSVYGIPSGRMLKIIPVFSVFPENGWGYSEETKPMLNTSHGFIPGTIFTIFRCHKPGRTRWPLGLRQRQHTPRVARISLSTFRTEEILELPNSGGNHSSPFITENTEYVVASTRFSVPPDNQGDVPISTFKKNLKAISALSA
ncbi:hypothetical protein [Spirosoma telluris]|uniref:hypothetical protein n=1 Tax=Spirosoma telluris TaxID=2183553 RepID=UPI002FC28F5F